MTDTISWVIGWFSIAVLLFAAGKFLFSLRRSVEPALANQQVRLIQILTLVWLLLTVAHCVALFAVQSLQASPHSASAFIWWALVNMLAGGQLQLLTANRPALAAKTVRVLLWSAVAASGTLLLFWPLALGVPTIPLTLPVDVTLGMGALGAIAVGVFVLKTPWRAQPENEATQRGSSN